MSHENPTAPVTQVELHDSVWRQLQARARSHTDDAALAAPGRPPLTHGELVDRVRDTVHTLNSLGIGRHDRVATVLPNGPEAALAFLAVACGASCAPLNPDYRESELDFFLSDLEARALIVPAGSDSPAVGVARRKGIAVLELVADPQSPAGGFGVEGTGVHSTATQSGLAEPTDVALLLHTSGTTSRPKLVPLTHVNVCASARNIARTLRLSPADRCLNVMPLFHIHGLMAAVLASLVSGGSVACTPGFIAPRFFEWMEQLDPTWYTAVPTIHQSILQRAAAHRDTIERKPLRFIRSSSSALAPATMERLETAFGAPVVESYGMTEAAHQMASNPLPPGERHAGSVGLAAGPEVAVMDESGSLRSSGTVGEVVIRGTNVTPGYVNNSAANAACFANGWFRTGDQGRLSEDGYLTLTGRLKEIINRGGEKISPREIDEVLLSHPDVHQAVAFALPDERLGEDVAAAVVPRDGASVSERNLRHHAAERLAPHKVPREIRLLTEIPKGPTGKLQRIGLAEKLGLVDRETEKTSAEPSASSGSPAIEMTATWAEVLGLETVGPDDDFLELGGDSILAALLLGRVRDVFGVEVSLVDFVDAPTAAGLAEIVSRGRAAGPAEPVRRVAAAPHALHEPFPLTDVQEAYWAGRSGDFQLGNVSTHLYMEIDGTDLDVDRLERAWQRLIDRHPMLRAVILPQGTQKVLEEVPRYRFERLDLQGRSDNVARAELDGIRQQMSHEVRPYDVWPLFEIRATRVDELRTRLHMSFDALILDAWSRSVILFREWEQLYRDPQLDLAPLELTYRDYVLAERAQKDGDEYRRAREYWERRLDDLPPAPELPLAVSPDRVSSPKFLRRSAELRSEEWEAIKKRAARSGLTPAGVLITAFAEVLKTWSRHPRFTLNLTTFNRRPVHPQVNEILGDFTSISLLEVDASAVESFESLAGKLQTQLWQDLDHAAMGGIEVLRRLAARQSGPPRALMPVVFTSAVARGGEEASYGWLGENVYGVAQTPQVWLDLQAFEEGGGLLINWNEVEQLFPEGVMRELHDAFVHRVRELAREPEGWDRLPPREALVPASQLAERGRVNATSDPFPEVLLHTPFEDQARQRPQQPAVIAPGRTVTYEELLSTSRRIARLLRKRGAQPNRLVAVVMEKGWEQVAAVLGVLQSGAAFLPIDSTTPTERLHHLLEHGQVELVVTQGCVDAVLDWPDGVQRITVNDRQLGDVGDDPLPAVQQPEDLAYVIYTSGSTGFPKGVMINHRGAANTIRDINRRFEVLPEDRVFAISALSFDLSVYDVFGTLAAGGTIVMPDASDLRDPVRWAEMVERERVTIWNSVPALMELLAETLAGREGDALGSLRLVLLSGDWIPVTLPDRVRELADARVIGLGGATEGSIWSIFYPVREVDPEWKSIPYGRPLANQSFRVLDGTLGPRPVWVPGELYIGGSGVALGYWNDEQRTNESFVRDPDSGGRLYRTGDLGRYLPGGEIEFLGREDFQVKVQGFRIELAEVEHALLQHPGVRAGVVQLGGKPRGKRHLVAYVVPESPPGPPLDELRIFLKDKLPDYMVPAQFVTLPALPLTANGKIDRDALPSPDVAGAPPPTIVSTGSRVDRVGAVIREVMELDTLDPAANLLHLGATSIDMIRVANLLERELEFRPSMDAFYAEPTANGLAALYATQVPEPAPAVSATPAQPAAELPSTPFIDDPLQRDVFKKTQPGLRRDLERRPAVSLEPATFERRAFVERRSVRRFGLKPIPLGRLGELLTCLRQVENEGKPKYRYGSAGALYPVQTYLYVKTGRVQDLPGGTYYHHPVEHRLVTLSPKVEIDPEIYDRLVNRPIFEESAFGIFFVAELQAIAPMYADRALHLSTIEAGLMTQLLEEIGPPLGLGLCQIGSLEFDVIRHFFALKESHVLLHSLLGGPIERGGNEEDESARLLRRVQELSPDEAQALLEAHREGGGDGS